MLQLSQRKLCLRCRCYAVQELKRLNDASGQLRPEDLFSKAKSCSVLALAGKVPSVRGRCCQRTS